MKILRAYIENFGKFSKKEFNFNEGFNSIIEENGFGKTTLATFIKAMFYGLKSSTKKLLDENEKRKYEPWQGGNYGGFLEFVVNNKEYRVERFFGKKDSEDNFSLIDLKTGKKVTDFTENLGEEIFGLDEASYERCCFIPQKEIDEGTSDKLSQKLINMIQGTSNKDSFENAINLIKEKTSELKKRGNAGKIAEKEAEIAELTEQIDSLKHGNESLNDFQLELRNEDEKINVLTSQKQEITDKIKAYGEWQEVVANKKYIDEKQKLKQNLELDIDYGNKILNGKEFSDAELENVITLDSELNNLKIKINSLKEENLSDKRFNELNEFFGDNEVDESFVNLIIEKEERLKQLKLKADNSTVKKETKAVKKNSAVLIALVCLSVLCLSLGFIFISKNPLNIILFLISGLSFVFMVVLYFKKYIDEKTMPLNLPQQKFSDEKLIKEKNDLEAEIDAVILLFNNGNLENKTAFLYDLKSKVKELTILKTEIENKNKTINSLQNKIDAFINQIQEFFAGFNLNGDLSVNEKVNLLKRTKETIEKAKTELTEVNKVLKEYKQVDVQGLLENIDIDKLQQQEAKKQEEIDIIKERKTELVRKIDKIKSKITELDELENMLEEKLSERNELKKQFQILNMATKFLTEANDNLTAKYKKPMQDSLNKYLKLVLDKKYSDFDISTELKVSFEECGMKRELNYLSKGYKGVVNLCVRFALISALFEKEKPFIVLDDPFVNFDKDKIQNALSILNELSKEYQIIYFSCHESRI